MVTQQTGVLADHVGVRRLVDAERLDGAGLVGHDVAVLPGDVGEALGLHAVGAKADALHLLFVEVVPDPLDHVPRHAERVARYRASVTCTAKATRMASPHSRAATISFRVLTGNRPRARGLT